MNSKNIARPFKAFMNWSGGKDSMLALHYVKQQKDCDICFLLTTLSESYNRIAMHGVREDLLIKQVGQLNSILLPVRLPEMPDMTTYEDIMNQQLAKLALEGITHSIYGDIFLEDLRLYRENQLAKFNMKAIFPLWKKGSEELVREFIDLGYKTIVVCAQEELKDFCGRIIDDSFLKDLPKSVDPCGENGEFHTFVFDGPMFVEPIQFELGELIYRTFPNPNSLANKTGFWYLDLIPI